MLRVWQEAACSFKTTALSCKCSTFDAKTTSFVTFFYKHLVLSKKSPKFATKLISPMAEQSIERKILDQIKKSKRGRILFANDFVKIGEWVYENIKYDIRYKGKNEIPATEIYKNRAGVCHHFTVLYNALLYSLGYPCIYVSGFVAKNNNCFNENNSHAWSLIKVNDKWLPFDATWGIFSGKLPVSHIFAHYFSGETSSSGTDSIKLDETKINGKFLE